MIDIYEFLKKSVKFELIYNDDRGRQISFETEVVDILEDRLIVKKPMPDTNAFDVVQQFDRLNTIAYTNEGVLSSNINFLGTIDDDTQNIYISFPYNNQFCQRRENSRTPMHIAFELEILNSGNGALVKHELKTKNVSGKGLACLTETPLVDFDNARIFMHFKGADIEAFCRKVYSKELILNGKTMYINGIAFTNISKEHVRLVMKKCLQFEIDAKHNERLFETL